MQILFHVYKNLQNRNMFIKNAVISASKKLIGQKNLTHLTNQFLVQLVFLTTIKNYLYKAAAEQNIFVIPQEVQKRSQKRKLILVLDMDETLVYTRRSTKPNHNNFIKTHFDGQTMYIQTRPHANQFLLAASQIFTIYIYTAGKQKYADTVLDHIDIHGVIQKRFYRDSCKKINGNFIKDLKSIKRTIRTKAEMILVDDNNDSIRHNYPFAVKINPFEGDQNDKDLKDIFQTILKFYH